MPKFIFQMGVNARAYGSVEAEADTIEQAVAMLTADYVGENISPDETSWDGLTGLAIIDVTDEDGNEIAPEYQGTDLPSPYDYTPPATPVSEALAAAREFHRTEPCASNLPLFERMVKALEALERAAQAAPVGTVEVAS